MSTNPYAAPSVAGYQPAPANSAETIRKENLSHEASVKSIGSLYMLGSIFMVPISLFMLGAGVLALTRGGAEVGPAMVSVVLGVVYFGVGILQGATALGLRKLAPWSRIVAIVFSCIGLLGIPIGTLISAYFLYLLLSKKGNYIFTEEYRQIVVATPHIKYRTSIIVIILLVLLVVLIFGGLIAAVVGAGSSQ